MNLISYLLLFFSIILSGSWVFMFKKISSRNLKLMLAFRGAFLFALTVTHLIPQVYKGNAADIGVFILMGFFLQILLELLSEGIEHGHIHIHKNEDSIAFPMGMMLGLCLHSFLEGMPLTQKLDEESTGHSLLAGIILHHIPVAMALSTMLLESGIAKLRVIIYLALFAAMAPAGALFSELIVSVYSGEIAGFYNKLMGIVIGIFLHISTTILFESSEGHRFNLMKFSVIVLGAGIAIFI
ncbi:MAG: zinc/iron permease [Bacteroidetes bacterium]|nr:MAG: zinc/iron permease [Bacteroidota bacterium]